LGCVSQLSAVSGSYHTGREIAQQLRALQVWVGELEAIEQALSPKPSSDVDGRRLPDILRQSDEQPVALLDGRGILSYPPKIGQ